MNPVMNTVLTLITQILPLVPGVVKGVTSAIDAFNHGTSLLHAIVTENREPTAAEWDEWTNRITAAHDALQKA